MSLNLSDYLNSPLFIRDRRIEKRLVLAPMTMLGNAAFRELLSTFGGYGLLFGEMCSAKRVPHENREVSPYFRWRNQEASRLVFQIFGNDPNLMATSAMRLEKEGFFGVDINFGCSVAAICQQNCGAAVLDNPLHAAEIVAAVRKSVSIPLFVKFRIGKKNKPGESEDLARRFEDAGADALTFHPRIAPDRRSRPPKWKYIKMVKKAVSIPVFGNGDVFLQKDCEKMIDTTGCDGIALRRMAVARPWIFAQWTDGLSPGPEIYLDTALRLTKLLTTHFDKPAAIRRFKKFAIYFSANFLFGHALQSRLRNAESMEKVEDILRDFLKDGADLSTRPNPTLFI
jgi:tRNA-dihydrouridine synthase B